MIDLSILVCSTTGRTANFFKEFIPQLMFQIGDRKNVQVLAITDNKIMTIGHKRNCLMHMANGKYVVFCDDDDIISPDYVDSLLSKIHEDSDIIVFDVLYRTTGIEKKVIYDMNLPHDKNEKDAFYRIPNHIMCFKKSVAILQPYPDINYGEDAQWAVAIKPSIKTQSRIDKTLYTYADNPQTSESRTRI